ncbi:MAG TPA: PEP-CTERM sorting domain-containing protein [Candidatus Acidoferrum sp.]|nr:PEP-CTERM sorting domain-containing protein [Candidatus Acidoferrum sp.]
MKKLLLTLGAVLGISAGAFAQGSLLIQDMATPDFAGVNTVTTNAQDVTAADYYTGSMILEIYAVQNSSLSVLQADQSGLLKDSMNLPAALSLLASDGYTQQTINGANSLSLSVSGGVFHVATAQTIGTSSSLPGSGSTVNTDYVIVGIIGTGEGLLALNPSSTGTPSPGTPVNMNGIWPGSSSQAFNLLVPIPEPTTLALAGLGGLSMLFLRRRKV